MELNANFEKRAVVHSTQIPWKASPMAGVDRRMLDRIGGEVARATSIVRYAPASHFSPHVHTGGEEFLVLAGVFQDEHGDFPAGSYIRNPPTSSHTPGSEPGCVIFVKLWQFDMEDRNGVKFDTNTGKYKVDANNPDVSSLVLFEDAREHVSMEKWAPGAVVDIQAVNGFEALVTMGGFDEGGEAFTEQSWLRLPKGATSKAVAGSKGATVWIKRNHLAAAPMAPAV